MSDPEVTLEGAVVRLEPLRVEHCRGLCEVGLEPVLWRWTPRQVLTADDMMAYIMEALDGAKQGKYIPFAIVMKENGKLIGSTRFGNIDRQHRKVEIGWTWIGIPWQRTAVNTEVKLLMLRHAFDVWHCLRVEFKTDSLNARSRAALLRLGAKEEGTLRSHIITTTGRVRDSVYFSIIAEEWPGVRETLVRRLNFSGRQ